MPGDLADGGSSPSVCTSAVRAITDVDADAITGGSAGSEDCLSASRCKPCVVVACILGLLWHPSCVPPIGDPGLVGLLHLVAIVIQPMMHVCAFLVMRFGFLAPPI